MPREITGACFKIILAVAEDVQDWALPTTVYWVSVAGESLKEEPTETPFHVYDEAPEAFRVPISSGQIETLLTLRVGLGTKFRLTVFIVRQFKLSLLESV